MTIGVIISTLSSSGLFASRIFLPIFLTSLAFLGQDKEWFDLGLTYQPQSWFVSWQFLLCAGIAAGLEQLAEENEDFQDLTEQATPYVKSAVSLVWTLMGMGVLSMDPEAQELLKTLTEETASMVGFGGELAIVTVAGAWIFAIPVAIATFVLAKFRNSVFAGISRNEVAVELGIAPWVARLELAWVMVSVVVLLVAPLVYLLLILALLIVSRWVRSHVCRQLDELAMACGHCDEKHYPIATRCPNSGEKVTPTHTLGVWGNILERPDTSEESHAFALYSWGRCPSCGSKAKLRCADCEKSADSTSVLPRERYIELVDAAYRKAFLPVFMFSLIPIFGIPLGAVYTRLFVLRPYRVHFSGIRKSCNRVFLNLLFLALVAAQSVLVPLLVFGPPAWLAYVLLAATGPAFLWLSYKFYRKGFLHEME